MEVHHEPVPTSPPPGMTHDSPDYEYAFTPAGAGYEHTAANVWILVKFAIWLTVSAVPAASPGSPTSAPATPLEASS